MKRISALKTILLSFVLVSTTHSYAQSQTDQSVSMKITATVKSTCILNAEEMNFSEITPANAKNEILGSAKIALTCTNGVTPSISISKGSYYEGSTRRAASAEKNADGTSNYLSYNLYQPETNIANANCPSSGTRKVWGDSTDATNPTVFKPSATTSSTRREFNVCGVIPGDQDPVAGTYTDTVQITTIF